MRRVSLIIVALVGITAGLVWWLTRDPEVPTTPTETDAPRDLGDTPFTFVTPDGEETVDAGIGRVSGRVVKEDGTPVAGARVRLFSQDADLERLECGVCKMVVMDCGEPSTVRRVIQGLRDGTIRPAQSTGEQISGADGTFVFEAVSLSGSLYATVGGLSGELTIDGAGEDLELMITPASPSVVTVVDAESKELSGVTVTVYSTHEGTMTLKQTDAEGHAAFETLDPDAYVFAEREGMLPVGSRLMGEVNLVLAPPRTLVIHTHLGTELVDADISIELHREQRTLRTKGGVLRLEQLSQGFYTVGAASDALAAASQSVELVQPVTELDFQLRRGSKLLVTVLSPTGDPLDAVSGGLSGADGDASADAEKGALLILGPVPEGEYALSLTSEGMVPVNRTVDLKPGETTLEVVMRSAPKLSGRVLGAEGKPVTQARIGAFESGEEIAVAISSDDGEFELEFQYSGQFELRAEDAREGVGTLKVTVPSSPVTLKLEAKGVLEVEVFDVDGSQLPSDVLVRSLKDQNVRWVEDGAGAPGRLAGLPTGKYRIEKTIPERVPIEADAEVTEGKVTRITLRANAGATVSGKVVDHLGKPVPMASVLMTTRADVVQTDEAGRFLIKGVPPGPGDVFATHPTGAESKHVKITAPAAEVVLTIPEIARVKGRVVDQTGAVVKSFDANGEKVVADDGRFDVAAPNHSLDLWVEGFTPIFMNPAEGDLGDVVLKKDPVAEGDVVDAEGKPVGGASVMASIDSMPCVTDANGHFKVVISEEKPQELIATRGAMSGRAPLKLGSLTHITLSRGTSVSGRVVDSTGKPVPTYVTATSSMTQRPMEIDTDESGRFQLELAQGIWVFSTRSNRMGRAVEVKGERMELTLGEEPGGCSAVVRSTQTIDGLWFLTAPATGDDGPWDSVRQQPGAIEVPISTPALEITVRGVPCGHYTVTGSLQNVVTSTTVDLRGPGQVVELIRAPETPAPQGETPSARPE